MQKLQSGSRPPRGGRGLKYVDVVYRMVNVESPPSRGAWIEIEDTYFEVTETWGRPPRGGRGLKSLRGRRKAPSPMSPPSRGAWIEISLRTGSYPSIGVAPLAGGVD